VTITLPETETYIGGSATDADGTIELYAWTQVSGPASVSFSNTTNPKPMVRDLTVAGTYVFKLLAKDNDGATATDQMSVIVLKSATKPTNAAPVANAGANQTITQPKNATDVTGAASTDSDGSIASYKWSQVSGPTSASIVSPTSVKTDLNRLTDVGTYVFRLTVTDNDGATDAADFSVVVKPNPANLLYANAGADQTINYPSVNIANMNGSGSYATNSGFISKYAWTKVSGPTNGESILNPAAQSPVVSFSIAGVYVLRLTVTDTYGNTATDDVTITVGAVSAKSSLVTENVASIALYPNPVVSNLRLTLKLNQATNIIARIFNSNGVIRGTYYLGTITSIQKDIDVSGLTSGMYILEVTDGNSLSLSNKFIKAN
jgi:hypothetical protein